MHLISSWKAAIPIREQGDPCETILNELWCPYNHKSVIRLRRTCAKGRPIDLGVITWYRPPNSQIRKGLSPFTETDPFGRQIGKVIGCLHQFISHPPYCSRADCGDLGKACTRRIWHDPSSPTLTTLYQVHHLSFHCFSGESVILSVISPQKETRYFVLVISPYNGTLNACCNDLNVDWISVRTAS